MRMLFVLIVGFTMLFIITTMWYVSQPIVVSISTAFYSDLGADAQNTMSLVLYCNIIWGPILDIIVIVWMIASAQMRDVESDLYG